MSARNVSVKPRSPIMTLQNQVSVKYYRIFLLVLCSVASIPVTPGFSQRQNPMSSVDPAYFKGLRYRSIGPHRGGRVTALAGHRKQPYIFYMGATGGGVWKTTDAGQLWVNVSDGFFETGSIGAIAV